MTLSLYKRSKNKTETIFNWAPTEEQWWITGFNPEFTNPNPKNMTMVCSVKFEKQEMFEAFNKTVFSDKAQIIIDEDYQIAWIQW